MGGTVLYKTWHNKPLSSLIELSQPHHRPNKAQKIHLAQVTNDTNNHEPNWKCSQLYLSNLNGWSARYCLPCRMRRRYSQNCHWRSSGVHVIVLSQSENLRLIEDHPASNWEGQRARKTNRRHRVIHPTFSLLVPIRAIEYWRQTENTEYTPFDRCWGESAKPPFFIVLLVLNDPFPGTIPTCRAIKAINLSFTGVGDTIVLYMYLLTETNVSKHATFIDCVVRGRRWHWKN